MNVTFDEEQTLAPVTQVVPRTRGLYALMIRWGFAKDHKQAEVALLATAIAATVLTIGIWIFAGQTPKGPSHEDVIRMQQREGV